MLCPPLPYVITFFWKLCKITFLDMQIGNELHGLKQIRGPDPNYKDICFSGAGR